MYQPQKRSCKHIVIALSIYFVIGVACANLLQTNFANLIDSNIPFMKSLMQNTSYPLYLLAMYAFGILAPCLINIIYTKIYQTFTIKNTKNNHKDNSKIIGTTEKFEIKN